MRGQRVLVSGMGSELGSLVASLLEREPWVGAVEGIDIDPPRRRLHRAVFHRIEPHQRQRVFDVVTAFNPHVVVHVAIWEPDARVDTAKARNLTDDAAATILGSAAECSALQHLVVRSAAEVYGRSRGALTRPDESAPTEPTSTFGRMALGLETIAADIGARTGAGGGGPRGGRGGRAVAGRGGWRRSPGISARAPANGWVPCFCRPSSAPPGRARSVPSSPCPPYRSACSPIRRSPSFAIS